MALTDKEIANVVFNETRSLSGKDIDQARQNVAHSIIYAVGPAEQEWMPGSLRSKLTLDNEVHARLKICPMPDGPHRGLREVCVDEAQDVRVTAPRR